MKRKFFQAPPLVLAYRPEQMKSVNCHGAWGPDRLQLAISCQLSGGAVSHALWMNHKRAVHGPPFSNAHFI